MNELTDYKNNRVKINKIEGLNQPFINSFIENIIETFEYSLSYYQVTKYPDNTQKYDCWIQEVKNSPKDAIDKKSIIMKPNQTIEIGEEINWMGKVWLTVDKETSPYYDSGQIQKCNNELKWYNSYNKLISIQSIATNNLSSSSLGINEGKITTVDGILKFILPNNSDTIAIEEGQRFIYKNRFAYKVTFIDLSVDGLVGLTLEKDAIRVDDDLINGIADNSNDYTYVSTLVNYSMFIENGTSINIQKLNSVQLIVKVYRNNELLVNPNITYTSNSLITCTVSNTGLVSALNAGGCTITVTYNGDEIITQTIDIVVKNSTPSNLLSVTIEGKSTAKMNSQETYIGTVYNNGVQYNAISLIWELTNVDGTLNKYASILSQGGTGCVVQTYGAVGIGKYVRLKAKLNTDYSIYKEFVVKIEGIL